MCNTCQAFQDEFAGEIIRKRLSLTAGETQVLLTMYRKGVYIPEGLGERGDVLVSRLRKILGFGAITTLRNQGYELSEKGRSKVSEVFHQQPQSMVA